MSLTEKLKTYEGYVKDRINRVKSNYNILSNDQIAETIDQIINWNTKANEIRTKLNNKLVDNDNLRLKIDNWVLKRKTDNISKSLASLNPSQEPFDLQDEIKNLEKEEQQRQKIEEAQQRIAEVEQRRVAEAKQRQLEEARQRVAVAEQMVEKQRLAEVERQRIAQANQERISNAEQQLLVEKQRLAEEQQEAERQINAAKNVREIEEAAERYDKQVRTQKKAQKDDIGLFKKAARLNEQRNREETNMAEKIDNPELVIPRQAPNQKQSTQKKTSSQKRRTRRNLLSQATQKEDVELFDKAAQLNIAQQTAEMVEKDYECEWTRPDTLLTTDNFIQACQILQIPDTQFYLKKGAEVVLNTAYENQQGNECYKFNQGNVRNNVDGAYRYLQLALASSKPITKSSEQLIYDRNCINPALSPNNYEEAKLILGLEPQLENLMARKSYRLAKKALYDAYEDRLKECVDNQSIVLDTAVRLENRTKLLAARQRILHNIEEMEIARPPMEPLEMGEDVNRVPEPINRRVPERFEQVILDPSGRQADSDSLADFDPLGPSAPGSSSIRRVPRESYPLVSELGALSSDIDALGNMVRPSPSSVPPRVGPPVGPPVGIPALTIAQTTIKMIILAKNILNIRSERAAVKSELLNNKNKLLYIIKNNITPIPDKLEEKVNASFEILSKIPEKLTKDPQNKEIEIDKYVNSLKGTDRRYLLNQMNILIDPAYRYKKLNFDDSRIIIRPRINNKTIKNISENVCEDIGQLNPLITTQRLFPSQIRKLTRKARYKDINKNVNARYQKVEKEVERVKKAKDDEAAKQIQEQLSLLEALENNAKSTNNEDIKRRISFNTRKLEDLNETLNDFNNQFTPGEREELDLIITDTKKLKKELEVQLARSKQGGNKHFTRKINKKIKNKG